MEWNGFFCRKKSSVEDYVREHLCLNAPVIAGLKPAAIFTVSYEEKKMLESLFSRYNDFRIETLHSGKKESIFLYRKSVFFRHLQNRNLRSFLSSLDLGYKEDKTGSYLFLFKERFRKHKDCGATFPHEVGIFLGYPPEDIRIYMEDPYRKAKLTGYWKVYSNEEAALQLFRAYDSCIQKFLQLLEDGFSLRSIVESYSLRKDKAA